MKYTDFAGLKLSRLGFGTMRLPLNADGSINEELTQKMVDTAIAGGVNYFDTAFPYHGGYSETVVGKCLAKYPRDSFYLATKYPGHQISSSYDPAGVFEAQLTKCGVDYFDFYLLHNVCENSLGVYEDDRWGIVDYFVRQKELGRIRHLGFSTHANPETLRIILEKFGDRMEFCQIQLNYLDWTLQDARSKCEILKEYGIPIWVMEPVRGGRLAKLSDAQTAELASLRPGESPASWAFRWLMRIPEVAVVLSGMSDMAQMKDNLKTFSSGDALTDPENALTDAENALTDAENALLLGYAEQMKNSLPCTACRYCCEGCPMGLDIPKLISSYNEVRFSTGGTTVSMYIDSLPEDKKPSACIGCGACAAVCPQKIDIPKAMSEFSEIIPKLADWKAISRQREEEAKRMMNMKASTDRHF